MKVKASVYVDANAEPRYVIMPAGEVFEVGRELPDMSRAQVEKWGAEQMFLGMLTKEQREAWDKLQKAR